MEKRQILPHVTAYVDPPGRSSCGMIHTDEGVVLVDTTARPVDLQSCLDMAGITTDQVCRVLITHSHSDHTSGIRFFDCPILAHKLTIQRIRKRGTERSKTRLPNESFEDRKDMEIGGVRIEMIHTGGHTPGSSVVWLPDEGILFAGDLVFQGRYPFLATADVEKLMDALEWLLKIDAHVIVPGHGELCGHDEVRRQLDYIQTSWKLAEQHLAEGCRLKDMQKDPAYPVYSERGRENLHAWNIKVIHQQLLKKNKNKILPA